MGNIGPTIKIHDIPKPIKATPFTQPEISTPVSPERVLMPVRQVRSSGGRIYLTPDEAHRTVHYGPCDH